MKASVRTVLRLAGKGDGKVAAVFGFEPASCHRAVVHLRRGAPTVPVWLFSFARPLPETAALCEHVYVHAGAGRLLLRAQRRLWPHSVAISVGTWTGGRGKWALKLAPLLVPPFRALFLNGNGDFFPGTPQCIAVHGWRWVRDRAHSSCRRVKDLLGVLPHLTHRFGLWMAAALLRGCSNPHRRHFRRLHGRDRLWVAQNLPDGGGVVQFVQRGHQWDAAELERVARASHARWILWQRESAACGQIDGMLPLFTDQNTFAVSRQPDFRAWKTMLFPTAPFRTLQDGEASEVLAPLASAILIDRCKLLALGIPETRLPGVAWLILFWKAAAAGWRSYSMGQRGILREQPDAPIDEIGFVLHLLSDRAMRRLSPLEPDLARGSIAFHPALQGARRPARNSSRPRVLIVSPFLPYPLTHGGAVRIYNLCRALSHRVDFALAAIRESGDLVDYAKLHEVFRQVYIVDKDEVQAGDERLPAQVRQHQSRSLRALIARIEREWKPDVLQIEYTHLAAFRDAAPETPAILVEHDLTFDLYRQLAEKDTATREDVREYERWLEFERRWLRNFDVVWTVSEDDREIAIREGGRNSGNTFAVPNGVDVRRYVPRPGPAGNPEVLFVGSFRHLPNVLAFEKLLAEVMPRVWRACPDGRLRVVAGPDYQRYWRFAANGHSPAFDSRVLLHGFVEDLTPLYAGATVVVAPLEVSAGTNIKVLEAMACGRPLVSTPVGCAGLGLRDGRDAMIPAGWDNFAHSVCELLADSDLRLRIAATARETAVRRFSWASIADTAYASYEADRGKPNGGRTLALAVWGGQSCPQPPFRRLVRDITSPATTPDAG